VGAAVQGFKPRFTNLYTVTQGFLLIQSVTGLSDRNIPGIYVCLPTFCLEMDFLCAHYDLQGMYEGTHPNSPS
jgi:hypothetical protein